MENGFPDILAFDDARSFLKLAFAAEKARRPAFGLRHVAKKAGFRSASTLSMIANGQRRLTLGAAEKLAKALSLSGARRQYLRNLARFDSATTDEEKLEAREAMLQLRHRRSVAESPLKQYRCLALWYYPVLYEMVALPSFRRDAAYLSRRLGGGVSPAEVERGLAELIELELLREEEGRLVQTSKALTTDEDVENIAIQRYHREMLSRAEASLALPVAERDLSGLTVRVAKSELPALKERIRRLRAELNETLSSAVDADEVYQFSFLLFPLTRPDTEDKP